MAISPLAGKPAPKEMLVDLARLEREYFERRPDLGNPDQLVSFGTSGHRGSPLRGTFTEAHILAITQAICDYRWSQATDGPLHMGKDTHALSGPAQRTALEVLAANGVETILQRDDGVTPTPVISRAILVYNRGRKEHRADGIVITPSHNPPEDGGFKYNPTHGGPADTDVTKWVQDRANELLRGGNAGVKRVPFATAIKAATPEQRTRLQKLSPEAINESELAGEPITAKLTRAPGNNAPIGGLKVVAASGWFAARPSGTENIYKIYAESFQDQAHLDAIVSEVQEIVSHALNATDPGPRQAEGRP